MKLEDYGEALAYETAFWMLGLDNPTYPLAQLGKLSLEISAKLRSLAILTLVVKADSDAFCHGLIRSSRARQTYLSRVEQAGLVDDHHRCLGRFDPVLDAIAAGAFGEVQRIRALSPRTFRAGHEYEDDHAYARILHDLCEDAPTAEDLSSGLDELEKASADLNSPRFPVCRALVERSQGGFDESFEDLLRFHASEVAKEKARGRLEDVQVIAERRVSIEGLAILRLAEKRGLATERDYLYCPSLARLPAGPFPGG
jgi:hypothetical protein